MQPPSAYKDIQKLTGCLEALTLCISNKAFEELKEYLGSPKLLSQPEEGEILQLYLVVSSGAPLKRVITRPQLSGRLTTWAIDLSEFDISYVPRTSIKAQAIADFVTECTAPTPHVINGPGNGELGREKLEWVMFVDGERNEKGSGAGILLRGPDGITMEYALRFTFRTTKNEAEYEALIAGLAIVKSLEINRIWVKGDSKLVIDQVKGACGVKHEPLVKYHAKAVQLAKGFELIIFDHIPRIQNEEADHLSRLATTYYNELPDKVYVEIQERPAHEENPTLPLLQEPEDRRTPIARYLVEGQLPGDGINLVGKLPKAKGSLEYVVVAVDYFSPGTYELERMNGDPIPRTWHASNLTKYYA
ncbi:hypothetical protein LIER_18119 [Lithospermum erythrorhizon]|uniref:RNase H type-1 domain-containing protein n=1 Tax=Lithospermum erythrorhizon TaxID=34254 RepID=A0AAV3QFM0_LITER